MDSFHHALSVRFQETYSSINNQIK